MTVRAEVEGMRILWAHVASNAIREAWEDMQAAKRRSRAISGQLRSVEAVKSRSREYFSSKDFREICDMAGIPYDPRRVMDFVTNAEGHKYAEAVMSHSGDVAARIVDLRGQGLSDTRIAASLGRSRTFVRWAEARAEGAA